VPDRGPVLDDRLHDAPADPAGTSFDELRLEREALLGDLERFLGAERYERLRAVGGIGLLADAFDCP